MLVLMQSFLQMSLALTCLGTAVKGGFCKSSGLLRAVFGAFLALTSSLLCLLLAWTADAEAAALSLACTKQ